MTDCGTETLSMTAEIWDVIIVGAGLSGLSAAHLLKKRNAALKMLILEGKDRVGGRTMSFDIPAANGSDRWDFGGQWVGSTQTHINELIEELGLETYPQFSTGKKVHHMGGPCAKVRTYKTSIPALSPLVLLDLTQLIWKIDRLCATVCVRDPLMTPNSVELDSMTLQSYFDQNTWTEGESSNDFTVLLLLTASPAASDPSDGVMDHIGTGNKSVLRPL